MDRTGSTELTEEVKLEDRKRVGPGLQERKSAESPKCEIQKGWKHRNKRACVAKGMKTAKSSGV